jgi:hypothetical protein
MSWFAHAHVVGTEGVLIVTHGLASHCIGCATLRGCKPFQTAFSWHRWAKPNAVRAAPGAPPAATHAGPRPKQAAALLALQWCRLQHLVGQLRRGLGEAYVDQQLRQPAARGVVALEARGEAGVAQQLGQALAQRLARSAGGVSGMEHGCRLAQ